jgi:formylmethanofuran dehydrogenase subunit E
MKREQIDAMRELGARGKQFGDLWDIVFESAFFIHGHLCGGMPLGFRAGVAALEVLGAERELNMAKLVFVETASGHAAGCFADGVQMATGCTFGKELIERTQYGKWALTLVDRGTGRAVRVAVRPEVMQASFKSPFVQQRRQGTAPTEIAINISKPLVEKLLGRRNEELFQVSEVFDYPLPDKPKPTFNLVTCAECGEAVAENKARVKDGQQVCIPCSGYGG